MTPVKRDSIAHIVLLYLKMKKSFISKENIYAFSPQRFVNQYNVQRVLNKLLDFGFVSQKDQCYAITNEGLQMVYRIPSEQKKNRD